MTHDNLTTSPRRKRWRWQWNLMTLLLLMAVVAGWTTHLRLARETEQVRIEIEGMRRLAGKLIVSDPAKFAVVSKPEQWQEELRWEVYLPDTATYRLKFATRDIEDHGYPAASHDIAIVPGQHTLSYQADGSGEGWTLTIKVDDKTVIVAEETKDWVSSGSSTSGGATSTSLQTTLLEPLQLWRKQIYPPSGLGIPQKEPMNGVLLWIESSQTTNRDSH